MKHGIRTALLLSLLFISACDYVEEVIIYHEPYLNIYANVTAADKALNYVHVFRTTGYGEPDRYEVDSIIYHEFFNSSSGDTIRYQTLYIDTVYAVNDADVCYIHGTDTLYFYERYQGVYVPTETNYTILTGQEYRLWVNTREFGSATAEEVAISPVRWQDTASTVISISNPNDTLRWEHSAAAYKLLFRIFYKDDYWEYSYVFHETETRNPFWAYDTSDFDPIFNPDPFDQYLNGEWSDSDSLELDVSIVAYSNSYLDYKSLENMQMTTGIIRYPTLSDFRVNIDNALGAFTSISVSDERKVLFIP
ncbi:MAG: hypothetical protein WC372_01665 [Candidatus Neomarinimicrobiota bacterium]|jgi:hypothetical protein|nr:hypothetical protein [Candidatus Neomarinimicrobiota bacterium]MDX9779640.1 hypothetical protein [bacterium]